MDAHLLLAAVAGGAALFLWSFISWVVLPWHNRTFRGFADEDDMVRAIEKSAPATGMYTLPSHDCGHGKMTPEEKKAARERGMARMKTGPTVQAMVVRGGVGPMPLYLLRSLLIAVIASGLAAWLLQKTAIVSTVDRALFVMLLAGVGNFAVHVSNWNWFRYPTDYTLVALLDAAVGWFLVGLAVAWVLPGA